MKFIHFNDRKEDMMKLTNSFWKKAIEAVILVLTAIAGALGANAL